MRCVLFTLMLLLLSPPLVFGQQQYTEGACILLDQQVQRFSHMPQSSSYRNAKNEYDKNCQKPTRVVPRETESHRDTAPVTAAPRPAEVVKQAEPAVTPPEAKQADTKQPDVSEPVQLIATPTAVAEQLLQAEPTEILPTEPVPAETDTPEGTASELPVAVTPAPAVVAPSDEVTTGGDWWQFDNLLLTLLNNLPLIIANIFAFLLAVFLLTNWLGLNLPGFKGIFAEYKLNRLLRWRLARGYRHFRKLKLLTAKDELVVVDHLVLSPFGIFVIMVKGYRGRIYGNVTEANWLRHYFGSKKQFMNPLHQNFKNVEAVKHHLQLQDTGLVQHVHSVIAFSRVAQFKTEMPVNVTYVDTAPAYLKKFEEPCFDDDQLNRFAALLRQASTAT